jgi:hypothetical protein
MERPRVTRILQEAGLVSDFSTVPPAVLEAAQRRGTAVHEAMESLAYGYEVELDEKHGGYLRAAECFLKDYALECVVAEYEVTHTVWNYVGHLDYVGWFQGERILLDWKTSGALELRPVSIQLAAYRMAWEVQRPKEPIAKTWSVQLRKDGTYKRHELNSRKWDHVFHAACVIYHARRGSYDAK